MTTRLASAPRSISPIRADAGRWPDPRWLSVPVWLAATAAGFVLVGWIRPDPFAVRGVLLPLTVLGLLALVLVPAALRLRVSAVACGLFAGWVALDLKTMLYGTPYGFAGLFGDMGRIAAAATRYSVTPWSADAFVEEVPAEYPMLYPWLIGRASALSGVPAWRLVAEAEILTVSGAVVAAFLLWSRLVKPPVALAVAAASLVAFGDPRKAFGVVAVLVVIPWILLTFGSPPRGRLPWWSAGAIGGLIVITYQGFLIYGSLGILALAGLTWWRHDDRRAYLLRLLKVSGVAALVSGVYVVPYLAATLAGGGQAVADLYVAPDLVANPFPFLQPTPLGLLQFAGLAGVIGYRRTAWWAQPLLLLIAGAYAYRVLMMARFVADGHTGFFHYTSRLLGPLLVAAGVLTVATLLKRHAAREYGVAALAVVLLWAGVSYWRLALPEGVQPWAAKWPSATHFYTARAHHEPAFPAREIRARVEEVRGRGARPRVLSADERLFAYLPWRGFTSVDRTSANTLIRWDERRAELVRLAAVTDPQAFAEASASTAFGAIDVFVLRDWRWRDVSFQRGQFDPARFAVVDDLPGKTVLLIRK
ncbi:arabinofuranosyltransferase [Nonomuraea sp. NPDC050310]|uniref:arabinofuranosyltransferase n=1 Tax=Nonomuraea sp. NPDC050310 TaxID=3154935 RepID=UPI0033C4737E